VGALHRFRRLLGWLYPGLGVKRWYGVILLGISVLGLGTVLLFNEYALDLVVIAQGVRTATFSGLLLVMVGFGLVVMGVRGLVRRVARTFLPQQEEQLLEVMLRSAQRDSGLRSVVIGGGTGLSALLRGLKYYTSNLTAIAAVSDDGGSSGRLREEQGVLPPGDIRNCLAALADQEPLMTQLLQYRFDGEAGTLSGHSLGNLLIAALTDLTGDFETAVKEMGAILAIRGRVLPPTVDNVVLCAQLADGSIVRGETAISARGPAIERVFLDPPEPRAVPEAVEAIRNAEVVIIGPGSTYTSVIPNLLVPGIVEALKETRAMRIFVCNVMTQPGETDDYTAAAHVAAILKHVGEPIFEYVLLNSQRPAADVMKRYEATGAKFVGVDAAEIARMGFIPIARDLLSEDDYARHDPGKLASAIIELVVSERQPVI